MLKHFDVDKLDDIDFSISDSKQSDDFEMAVFQFFGSIASMK